MPTVKLPLPLTRWNLYSKLAGPGRGWGIKADQPLYFVVEEGELIVSTEPLGDDPSVAPLAEGAYTP